MRQFNDLSRSIVSRNRQFLGVRIILNPHLLRHSVSPVFPLRRCLRNNGVNVDSDVFVIWILVAVVGEGVEFNGNDVVSADLAGGAGEEAEEGAVGVGREGSVMRSNEEGEAVGRRCVVGGFD
ncbi:uncharacterized protein DS421_19g663400 [Arachis hypogaea]|uniref:Uncharacterized protein n=1 Tax=Arachis hypogaea TaxID=3818 RepID=A0A6B9VBX9_ARAHY|nr:uncharacterized protein DS421_19g663400 [Arachis hypogaea]